LFFGETCKEQSQKKMKLSGTHEAFPQLRTECLLSSAYRHVAFARIPVSMDPVSQALAFTTMQKNTTANKLFFK
jgi:hypothetical protein